MVFFLFVWIGFGGEELLDLLNIGWPDAFPREKREE